MTQTSEKNKHAMTTEQKIIGKCTCIVEVLKIVGFSRAWESCNVFSSGPRDVSILVELTLKKDVLLR